MSVSGIIDSYNADPDYYNKIYPDLIPWQHPLGQQGLGSVLQVNSSAFIPNTTTAQDATDFATLGCVKIETGTVGMGNQPALIIGEAGDLLQIKGGTDLGSILVGNGLNTEELVCPTTATTSTTSTIYNWNTLSNGQSKIYTVDNGSIYQLGYSITINYSGTDSVSGTITAISGNDITITITAKTSLAYVNAPLITTTPPDGAVAGNPADGVFGLNPATTIPSPPDLPANSMIVGGDCFFYSNNSNPTPTAITITILGTNIQRATSPSFNTPLWENPTVTMTTYAFPDGCFVSDSQIVSIQTNTGGIGIAFGFPSGGSFVNQDYCGELRGYTLSYSSGLITINSKLVLTADNTKPLGVFWGVDAQGVGTVTSVSAGNNISMSGSLSAPVVNLSSPLTSDLALGTLNISGSTGNITLSSGGSTSNSTRTELTISNATDNSTINANGIDTNYFSAGVASANADLNTNSGNATLLLSSSNLPASNAHLLSIECPLVGDATIDHTTIGAPTRNLAISTQGNLTMTADNIDLNSAGRLVVPSLTSGDFIDYNNGSLKIVNDSVGGIANPLLILQNNNATGGGVTIETYKNDTPTSTGGDVIGIWSANANTNIGKTELTRISHLSQGVGSGNNDGTIVLACKVNSSLAPINFIICNGGTSEDPTPTGEVQFFRDLNLNSNDIRLTSKIQTAQGLTYGLTGQILASKGNSPLTWINPNQSVVVQNYTGGYSIDSVVPSYFGANITLFNIQPSTSNRYKVDFSISIEGGNDNFFIIPEVVVAGGTPIIGEVFRSPLLGGSNMPYVSIPATYSGVIYHSVSFSDYFTFTVSNPSFDLIDMRVGIICATGTHSITNLKISTTLSPSFL